MLNTTGNVMRHRCRLAFFLIFGIFFASACSSEPEYDISGRVLTADGNPVPSKDVYIAYHLDRIDHNQNVASVHPGKGSEKNMFSEIRDDAEETPDTHRLYPIFPNPSCDGIQSIIFDLPVADTVTIFARSVTGGVDYDHLFMEPMPAGRHHITFKMLPGFYEINVTFLPDTLISYVLEETLDVAWDRSEKVTHCAGSEGFPGEKLATTDNSGRFSANRSQLDWNPRHFRLSGPEASPDDQAELPRYRLGHHAAIVIRDEDNSWFREINLEDADIFIELEIE